MMRRLLIGVAVALAIVAATTSYAGESQAGPSEYQVKAAYLYNFGRFVDWPTSGPDSSVFTVCVLGRDPFGETLDRVLAGVTVNNHPAAARRVVTPQESRGCRVVFIAASEETRLGQILAVLDKAPLLTVSDMPDFTHRGGMIQFVLEGNRVRFEVNVTAATDAGLSISSDLLKVAVAVHKRSRQGA